jgi:hypothetical protein
MKKMAFAEEDEADLFAGVGSSSLGLGASAGAGIASSGGRRRGESDPFAGAAGILGGGFPFPQGRPDHDGNASSSPRPKSGRRASVRSLTIGDDDVCVNAEYAIDEKGRSSHREPGRRGSAIAEMEMLPPEYSPPSGLALHAARETPSPPQGTWNRGSRAKSAGRHRTRVTNVAEASPGVNRASVIQLEAELLQTEQRMRRLQSDLYDATALPPGAVESEATASPERRSSMEQEMSRLEMRQTALAKQAEAFASSPSSPSNDLPSVPLNMSARSNMSAALIPPSPAAESTIVPRRGPQLSGLSGMPSNDLMVEELDGRDRNNAPVELEDDSRSDGTSNA